MASVNVEFHAFLDPRFRLLAKLSGLSHFDAIGRMTVVWVYSIEKNTAVLKRTLFDTLAEIDGYVSLAIQADLAEEVDSEYVRVKGTEGRIEWLNECRERQKIATQAAKEKRDMERKKKLDPKLDPKSDPTLVSSSASTSASALRKKKSVDPTDTTLLWEFYKHQIKAKGIEAVHGGAKTNTWCKTLITSHGIQKAKTLIEAYLRDEDPFNRNQAWTLGILISQQQKYLAKASTGVKRGLDFGEESL